MADTCAMSTRKQYLPHQDLSRSYPNDTELDNFGLQEPPITLVELSETNGDNLSSTPRLEQVGRFKENNKGIEINRKRQTTPGVATVTCRCHWEEAEVNVIDEPMMRRNIASINSALGDRKKGRQNVITCINVRTASKFDRTIKLTKSDSDRPIQLQLTQGWKKNTKNFLARLGRQHQMTEAKDESQSNIFDLSLLRGKYLVAAAERLNVRGSHFGCINRKIDLKTKFGILNPNIQVEVELPHTPLGHENEKSRVFQDYLDKTDSESDFEGDTISSHQELGRPNSVESVMSYLTSGTDHQGSPEDNVANGKDANGNMLSRHFMCWPTDEDLEGTKRQAKSFSGLTLRQKRRAQSLAQERSKAGTELNYNKKGWMRESQGDQRRTPQTDKRWVLEGYSHEHNEKSENKHYKEITAHMDVIVPPPSHRARKAPVSKSSSRCASHCSSDHRDLQKLQMMRLRKELPPPQPRRLCFRTSLPGCSHCEVKQAIESQSGATVVWMQYDPVQLNPRRGEFSCLWIFQLASDAAIEPLLFEGFSLHDTPMNVRRLDDVYKEEHTAYLLCSEVFMEQKKRKLLRKSSDLFSTIKGRCRDYND
uniref:Uncharacterized protein n=1 Tax=Biomphalaria glabrata TaxID=6526 RepID=A0A2C9LU05_BIOGL